MTVIPVINSLLDDDERDQLQAKGRVDKTITKQDIMESDFVKSMKHTPRGFGKWVDGAIEFLVSDLKYARKAAQSDPQQYIITVDNTLIKGELRDLLSQRAATKSVRELNRRQSPKRTKGDMPGQMKMFE